MVGFIGQAWDEYSALGVRLDDTPLVRISSSIRRCTVSTPSQDPAISVRQSNLWLERMELSLAAL